MNTFPVEYSSLSTKELLNFVIHRYELDPDSSITFLKRGFNDTYLIKSRVQKYILRAYKHNWRNYENILTEVKLLNLLRESGMGVSFPISSGDQYIFSIKAPEGLRHVVLFSYAEGSPVKKLNVDQACLLGCQTGKMHRLTINRSFGPTPQDYHIDRQFNTILGILKRVLSDHEKEYHQLLLLKEDFTDTFRNVDPEKVPSGLCHGDLQAENFHISETGELTFFDFDFLGPGYLAYDIGVFIWYDHKNKPPEIVRSFLKGYDSIRSISDEELRLLPYFSILRALFQMTLYCNLNDGIQMPLWPPAQAADFIHKVANWKNEFKPISRQMLLGTMGK